MSLPQFGVSEPLSPPMYPAAVYRIPDLDALDAIYAGTAPGFIYARDGHPNAQHLAAELAKLSAAAWGVVTGSGMGALVAAFLTVPGGGKIVASDQLYGKTTKLLRSELSRYGVRTEFVNANDLAAVRAAMPADLVVAETISNPLCRVADIPALADIAHRHGAKLLLDNTFASPALCKPLELGADFAMESLTKMINGHSDVTLGFLAGRDPSLAAGIGANVSTWGLAANPFDCWLAERGLPTLELRMRTATANAAAIADFLAEHPAVRRVIYPGRRDHIDHTLAQHILPHGCGHMLCFELDGRDAVNRFLRAGTIPFCPSLGHVTTTCSHPDTTSHRYESAEAKRALTITPGLVRLSVGCERTEEIRELLTRALGSEFVG